jgi:hypothetical protein
MNKTDKIIELKKLLDSGLINQSDFERLKKQIFEGAEETISDVSLTNQPQITENVQSPVFDFKGAKNSTKRCPQCGSDNEIELSFCSVCNTDFSILEEKSEDKFEIEAPDNNSKIIFIGLFGLVLLIFVLFYFLKNKNNNVEAEVATDIKSSVPESTITSNNQENNSDTLSTQIDTISNEYKSNSENNPNPDNYESIDFSQENESNNDENIYNTSEIEFKPDFPGGIGNFYKYIGKNFQVPDEKGLSGKVFVSFVIEKDGSLTDIKVIKDIGFGTGQEAVRVLESSPRWKPAEQNGKKVRVLYSLPINIQSAE